MDRAFRGQIFRDRAPLTAGRENVHEAVYHLPHDHRTLTTASLARRDQRFDQSPFVVGQIARISQLAAVVTGAVYSRPHGDPFSNQATTLESQMIHLIQELFGQTLTAIPTISGCAYSLRRRTRARLRDANSSSASACVPRTATRR